MRYPIVYAERTWERFRFWGGLLVGFYLLLAVVYGLTRQNPTEYLFFTFMAALLLAVLYVLRRRQYLELVDEGIAVHGPFRTTLIRYSQVDRVKVQSLRHHFQDKRASFARGAIRQAMDSQAIFLRIPRREDYEALARALGSRDAHGGEVAIPVERAEELAGDIAKHVTPGSSPGTAHQARRRKRR